MAGLEFRIIDIPDKGADGTRLRVAIGLNPMQGVGQFLPDALRSRRIISLAAEGTRADLYQAYTELAKTTVGERVAERSTRRLFDADMGVAPVTPGVNLVVDTQNLTDGAHFVLFTDPTVKATAANIVPVVSEMYVIGHMDPDRLNALVPDQILVRKRRDRQPLPSLSAEEPLLAGAAS